MTRLERFFRQITGRSTDRVTPEIIINKMKRKIAADDPNTDYINELGLQHGTTLRDELMRLISEDDEMSGGGQGVSGVAINVNEELEELLTVTKNEPKSIPERTQLAKALLATITAMATLNQDNVDYVLISSCLTMLNNSLLSNNKISDEKFDNEVNIIKGQSPSEDDMDVDEDVNQCQYLDCQDVNTKIDYLNSIDEDIIDKNKNGYRIINENIYDPQTENLSREIRNQQLTALRQSRMTDYFPPIIGFIHPPKEIYLIDDSWGAGTQNFYCLYCAKGKETRGYDFTQRKLYSPNTMTTKSSILWSLYNNGRIMKGHQKSIPAKFCSYCAKKIKRLRSYKTQNIVETQQFLNTLEYQFHENLALRKQLEDESGDATESGSVTSINDITASLENQYISDSQQSSGDEYSSEKMPAENSDGKGQYFSQSDSQQSSGDEYSSEKMPAENSDGKGQYFSQSDSQQYSNDDTTYELKKLKENVYWRVINYVQNGPSRKEWWTKKEKTYGNPIIIGKNFSPNINNINELFHYYFLNNEIKVESILNLSLEEAVNKIFIFWKKFFDNDPFNKTRHLWISNQEGGKKKNKTKKRKRKKKKTKRKNKRRKKTKRRRRNKKKTRRKNKPRKRK